MRVIALGVASFGVVVVVLIALIQIVNTDTRETSLRDTLHNAMSASLATALDTESYSIENHEDLVADVAQGIILELDDPKAELKIEVIEVDILLGIVSMRVTATYPSVTGNPTAVTVERTIVLEQEAKAPSGEVFSVKYLGPGGSPYKSYLLVAGSQEMPYVDYPAEFPKSFLGWRLTKDGVTTMYGNSEVDIAKIKALPLDSNYVFQVHLGIAG